MLPRNGSPAAKKSKCPWKYWSNENGGRPFLLVANQSSSDVDHCRGSFEESLYADTLSPGYCWLTYWMDKPAYSSSSFSSWCKHFGKFGQLGRWLTFMGTMSDSVFFFEKKNKCLNVKYNVYCRRTCHLDRNLSRPQVYSDAREGTREPRRGFTMELKQKVLVYIHSLDWWILLPCSDWTVFHCTDTIKERKLLVECTIMFFGNVIGLTSRHVTLLLWVCCCRFSGLWSEL